MAATFLGVWAATTTVRGVGAAILLRGNVGGRRGRGLVNGTSLLASTYSIVHSHHSAADACGGTGSAMMEASWRVCLAC